MKVAVAVLGLGSLMLAIGGLTTRWIVDDQDVIRAGLFATEVCPDAHGPCEEFSTVSTWHQQDVETKLVTASGLAGGFGALAAILVAIVLVVERATRRAVLLANAVVVTAIAGLIAALLYAEAESSLRESASWGHSAYAYLAGVVLMIAGAVLLRSLTDRETDTLTRANVANAPRVQVLRAASRASLIRAAKSPSSAQAMLIAGSLLVGAAAVTKSWAIVECDQDTVAIGLREGEACNAARCWSFEVPDAWADATTGSLAFGALWGVVLFACLCWAMICDRGRHRTCAIMTACAIGIAVITAGLYRGSINDARPIAWGPSLYAFWAGAAITLAGALLSLRIAEPPRPT
jgi:hypothetical protein